MIRRIDDWCEDLMGVAMSGGGVRRAVAVVILVAVGLVALAVGGLAASAQIAALYLVAAWMGTSSPTLPALVLVGCMYPVWRCWRWWRAKRIVEKPTFFEVEYTDNAGCILRALTPEAQAWAKKCLEPPLPNGDYLVSRATVGIVVAGASARGYLVRLR
jgi:hypothetical protein